jgi:hypothetical protein
MKIFEKSGRSRETTPVLARQSHLPRGGGPQIARIRGHFRHDGFISFPWGTYRSCRLGSCVRHNRSSPPSERPIHHGTTGHRPMGETQRSRRWGSRVRHNRFISPVGETRGSSRIRTSFRHDEFTPPMGERDGSSRIGGSFRMTALRLLKGRPIRHAGCVRAEHDRSPHPNGGNAWLIPNPHPHPVASVMWFRLLRSRKKCRLTLTQNEIGSATIVKGLRRGRPHAIRRGCSRGASLGN